MSKTLHFARTLVGAACLGLAGLGGAAHASIVDFEVGAGGSCYTVTCTNVQGYDFSFVAGGWAVTDDGNGFFNRNGRAVTEGLAGGRLGGNGAPPLTISMVLSGGGVFDLAELEMATGLATFAGSSTVDIVGDLFGGGQVSQTVSVTSTWASVVLTGFTDVTRIVFSNRDADAGISIDNLDSIGRNVPEPSGLALVGLACLGVWGARKARPRG